MNNYRHPGDVVDAVLEEAVTSNQAIALGAMAGVATTDGEIGDTVAMAIEGAFYLPLKTGGSALPIGTPVSLDVATGEVYGGATTTDDLNNAGKVSESGSAETDSVVEVKLTPGSSNIAS